MDDQDIALNSDVFWRPTFSVEVFREEQTSNEIVANALLVNGSQSVSHLYESLNKSYCQSRWKNISMFVEYIKKRSHMFNYNAVSGKISNRGFGFMRGIIVMVTYICDKNQEGSCKLEDLFNIVSKLPHYTYNMPWEDRHVFEVPPKNVDELSLLLKRDHSQIFNISNGNVTLNDDIRLISSYWSPQGQVRRPAKDNKFHYIDSSRKYTFYVYIITRTATYLKGIIESGIFINRSVYILGKNVGLTNAQEQSAIPDNYATGTRASVTASFCLNGACSFTATHIMADGMCPDIYSEIIGERDFSDFFQQTVADSCDWEDDTMGDEDITSLKIKEINCAMEQERRCQIFSDNIFGENEDHDLRELMENYTKAQARSPFRSAADFQNFITTRKHLYEILANETIAKKSDIDRMGFNQLFDLLKLEKYGSGISLTDLKNCVKVNRSLDSFKMLYKLFLRNKIEEVINSYYFDIVRLPEPREGLLILRGVYSSEKGCFLSGYAHDYNKFF